MAPEKRLVLAERARNRNCVLRLVLQDNYPEPFHGSRGSRVMRRERTLRESAAAALTQSVLTGRDDPNLRVQAIVRGFEILSRGRPGRMEFGSDEEALPELFIKGAGFYGAQLNAGHAVGTVQSIEHALRALDKSAEDEHERLARSEKMLSDYREQLGKTFVHEARVKELLAKQDELNRALELDNCERQVAPEEAGEADQIPDCRGDQADRAGEQDA